MSIVERSLQRLKAQSVANAEAADQLLQTVPVAAGATAPWPQAPERMPLLTYLPEIALDGGFSALAGEQARLSGQMRALRRRVLDAIASRRNAEEAAIVVVTSALPGDGKSFIAVNLASAFVNDLAMVTTLVDADIARQRVSRLFAGTPQSTLSQCIIDRARLAGAVHRTDFKRVQLVPAGAFCPQMPDQMASSSWDGVVAEMRAAGGSNLFLIDTPPVLVTSEAQYVAHTADVVLIVVRAEVTPCSAVAETVVQLKGVRAAAFVFNAFAAPSHDAYHDYASYHDPRD